MTWSKPKLTPNDIGMPSNFQHVQHVGWDSMAGFDFDAEKLNPSMKTFLKAIGVTNEELKDTETRKFIYDFVNKNGGFEAAAKKPKRAKPEVPKFRKYSL